MGRPAELRAPSLLDCMLAVGFLIVLVAAGFLLFGEDAADGPNQVALGLAATLAAGLAWKNGHHWDRLREAVVGGHRLRTAGRLHFVRGRRPDRHLGNERHAGRHGLLCHGGSQPQFLLSDRLARSVPLRWRSSIGSSWTVARTIGVGLMGIAEADGSLACDHRRCGHLRCLFRRQGIATVRHSATLPPPQPDRNLFEHIRLFALDLRRLH